jgi:hypothetical protein
MELTGIRRLVSTTALVEKMHRDLGHNRGHAAPQGLGMVV